MSKKSKCYLSLFSIACVICAGGAALVIQDNDDKENSKLLQRVDLLEKRVQQLETVVFSTARLSLMQAERRLLEAETALKDAELLFTKGMITRSELNQRRFLVTEAFQEMELAKTENRQQEISSKLEFIQAEQALKNSIDLLNHNKRLFEKGYVSKTEIERLERQVDIQTRALENAKLKFEAAKNLKRLKQNQDK